MSTPVNVFHELVEELRATGPHRLRVVLGSPGALILPLIESAGGWTATHNALTLQCPERLPL